METDFVSFQQKFFMGTREKRAEKNVARFFFAVSFPPLHQSRRVASFIHACISVLKILSQDTAWGRRHRLMNASGCSRCCTCKL